MNSYNSKEILSTLRFGARAKNIKNKPIVNQERSVKELEMLLGKAEKEILTLKKMLGKSQKFIEKNFDESTLEAYRKVLAASIDLKEE